jgi:hypothetical protein
MQMWVRIEMTKCPLFPKKKVDLFSHSISTDSFRGILPLHSPTAVEIALYVPVKVQLMFDEHYTHVV